MNPIDKLPDLDWTDVTREELVITGDDIVRRSDVAYRIGNVAVAGLIYYSFCSPPWFWFGLAEGVRFRDLIDFRALREKIPQGATTAINAMHDKSLRFARFYGFEPTGQVREFAGNKYLIYRRA